MARVPKRKSAPRRRVARRKVGRRVARRRMPVGRMPKATTGNFASVTEQYSGGITAGVAYDFGTSINNLVRAKQIASAYQYYRITSVELRFKPYFDTFANGLSSGQTIPYLNFQYDKSGALSGLTAPQFEEIGTKAVRLDDKTLVRKWKPSVITQEAGTLGITQFKVSPWLPTFGPGNTLNIVEHLGAVFYISKMTPTDSTVYDLDIVLNVQFRKPLVVASGESVPVPIHQQTNETVIGPPKETSVQ